MVEKAFLEKFPLGQELHAWNAPSNNSIVYFKSKNISTVRVINFTVWMETQRQTNGDTITTGGQKPKLDNSVANYRIA